MSQGSVFGGGAVKVAGAESKGEAGAEGKAESQQPATTEVASALYTSSPTQSLKLGRFQFERGTMKLEGAAIEEFDSLLAQQPPQIKSQVKKVSRESADAVAKKFLATQGSMVKGVDVAGNGKESGTPGSSQ